MSLFTRHSKDKNVVSLADTEEFNTWMRALNHFKGALEEPVKEVAEEVEEEVKHVEVEAVKEIKSARKTLAGDLKPQRVSSKVRDYVKSKRVGTENFTETLERLLNL